MIAFVMLYRIWFQLAAVGLILGGLVWGYNHIINNAEQRGYDKAVAEYQVKLIKAQQDAKAQEVSWKQQLETANANYAKRQAKLTATIATASAANAGLLDTLQHLRDSVSSDSVSTLAHRVTTLSTVLGDCSTAYQGLANTCDRIANDEQRILDSWPH